jgi:hypothetical protein
MSMYVQLLDASLDELVSSTDLTAPDALAELVRRRSSLCAKRASHLESHLPASDSVSDELSYDVALIRLARVLGIACDVKDFERPGHGRARIELNLVSRGIEVDELDPQTRPVPDGREDLASGS